jgi:protein-disulfide isomerase
MNLIRFLKIITLCEGWIRFLHQSAWATWSSLLNFNNLGVSVMNGIYKIVLVFSLVFLNGCEAKQKIDELTALVKKLESRVESMEKLLQPVKPPPVEHVDVPLDDSPVLGNKDAKIHVVVFSNFQCPYCAMADKALRKAIEDPELKDKINIVFKNFPFERHPEARPAAKAALAAREQGKFWEMTQILFENQKDLSQKNFEKWAKDIGLDVNKFNRDLKENDKKYDEIINRDYALGEKINLGGTPWILINGWRLDAEPNAENIKKLIQEKNLTEQPNP